jgi:cyclophilin family peptidyl-prolyl cis-trans isomerase
LRSGITPDTVPPFVTASPELTMKRLMTCLFVTLWCALETACFGGLAPPVPVTSPSSDDEQPPVVDERARVELLTSEGSIMLALDEARAPVTATNFLRYVDDGFFDGDDGGGPTVFHRYYSDDDLTIVQGGGELESGATKRPLAPIELESDNGLSNLRGTIAMARTEVEDSANSQFFINLEDNQSLDVDGLYAPGYAVFGEVLSGLDVAAVIADIVEAGGKVTITDAERSADSAR